MQLIPFFIVYIVERDACAYELRSGKGGLRYGGQWVGGINVNVFHFLLCLLGEERQEASCPWASLPHGLGCQSLDDALKTRMWGSMSCRCYLSDFDTQML